MGNAVTPKGPDRATLESYLIRVYRRSDEPGHEVAGLIESVERGPAKAFTGRDELWAALARAPAPRRLRTKARPPD